MVTYTLNDPLTLFFCTKHTRDDGTLQMKSASQQTVWGRVMPNHGLKNRAHGNSAYASSEGMLRPQYNILLRRQIFEKTLQHLVWQRLTLTPLCDPFVLQDHAGFMLLQTTLLKHNHP